jgi:hypothetical protein
MARSRCPRESCEGTAFELTELKVDRSPSRIGGVQCSRCGAVVGVVELPAVTGMLERMARKMGVDV